MWSPENGAEATGREIAIRQRDAQHNMLRGIQSNGLWPHRQPVCQPCLHCHSGVGPEPARKLREQRQLSKKLPMDPLPPAVVEMISAPHDVDGSQRVGLGGSSVPP